MEQIVTLSDRKIATEEKKLLALIKEYQRQVVLLDTDDYNIERKYTTTTNRYKE